MKKPRFFCDFCGKEVPGEAKVCPWCGSFFTSVRCPRCGFTAFANKFKFGCPSCGYSAPPESAANEGPPAGEKPKRRAPAEPLPLWAYLLAAAILCCAVGGLIAALSR